MDRRTWWWVIPCAALLAACSAAVPDDPRVLEVWSIDLDTYGAEVAVTLTELDLDRIELERETLRYLRDYFDGLPIVFEVGVAWGDPLKSSVCIRHGSGSNFGRGFLDEDNTEADHNCGEPDGTEHGVFINRLAQIFEPFSEAEQLTGHDRVDLFARLLSMVIAHEVGHGIGLTHSEQDFGVGDIMKETPVFGAHVDYFFSEPARATLATNLLFGPGTAP